MSHIYTHDTVCGEKSEPAKQKKKLSKEGKRIVTSYICTHICTYKRQAVEWRRHWGEQQWKNIRWHHTLYVLI